MAPDDSPLPGSGSPRDVYDGPERRKKPVQCELGDLCKNLLALKVELAPVFTKVGDDYAALERRVGELSDLVRALPKMVSDQIEVERKQASEKLAREMRDVDKDLNEGSKDFKEIKDRLRRLEMRLMALAIIVGIFVIGKIAIWAFGLPHFL